MTPDQEVELARARLRISQAQTAERAQTKAQKQEPQKAKESWYEDLAEGVAVSGMDTYYGVKDLFGLKDAEDQATLDDWRADAGESGWGTAGQVLGEVGQMALPAGALLKGAKGLSKAKNLAKGVAGGIEAATAAGHGYIKDDSREGESRMGNALLGAGGSLAGGAIGGVLKKALKGIDTTDTAKALMKEGVELTPAQASAGKLPRAIEALMEYMPTTSAGTRELKERAVSQWSRGAMKKAAPPNLNLKKVDGVRPKIEIKGVGEDANNELIDAWNKVYRSAWDEAGRPDDKVLFGEIRSALKTAGSLDSQSGSTLRGLVNEVVGVSQKYSPKKLEQVDKFLRNAKDQAYNPASMNRNLGKAIDDLRQGLRNSASPKAQAKLREIDSEYAKYLAYRKAVTANKEEGVGEAIFPKALMKAGARVVDEEKYFSGGSPLYDYAKQGAATVGRREPKPILDIRKALARNINSPTPLLDFGSKATLGQTKAQKAALRELKPLADALRSMGINSRRLGGALAN